MILLCPNCSTGFSVPDDAVGPDGRRVRCGNCGHVWQAVPKDAVSLSDEKEPEPIKVPSEPESAGEDKPTKTETQTQTDVAKQESKPEKDEGAKKGGCLTVLLAGIGGIVLLMLAILLLARGMVIEVVPSAEPVYKALGLMPEPKGPFLELRDVGSRTELDPSGAMVLVISGTVVNISETSQEPPTMVASIIRDDESLQTWRFQVKPDHHEMILPGQAIEFEEKLHNPAAGGTELSLRFEDYNPESRKMKREHP